MSSIHVKEAVLKALPNLFHPLTPPLFVEQGQMPCRDKNKSKSAIIYVNLCGVYFLRPISFSKKYKLSQFVSTYDISEIDYKDKGQCDILTKSKSLYIHCEHCEEAVSSILSARRLLYKDMKEPFNIQIVGFPSPPASPNLQVTPDVSIVTLRYIAMCSKRNFIPEGRILDIFNKFNPATHITLTLDESCIAPPNVKNLLYPIYTFKHVQILRFKGFAPFFVCRFVHHLVKRAFKVDSIIFEGYSRLIPEQLRMEKTRGLRPLSFVFKNCNFDEATNDKLFEQLGKYPGEISRISFINYFISAAGWKSLFDTITQSRSFKELEMFEINNVDPDGFYDELVTDGVKALLKHCRFIMKLSVSNWNQPIHFGINNFQNYLLLSEINLAGQDMTQPLPDDFKMLRMVHCLNLSRCNFSFNSLQSLFKVLSTARAPIAVRLADIKLPEAHWKTFYTSLNTFPPINSLCELDWSGNALYSEYINNFANYFFAGSRLRYLQIDRIFGSQQAEDLYNLLNFLSGKTILGVSICGSPELNFGGNLKSLLRAVELIMNLHILRLDGQKITDLDTVALLDYLKIQRTLNDVSFDDTCINDQQRFFDFYKDICSLNIDAVGRPFKDMDRLFASDLTNVYNPSHYDEFQSQIRLKSDRICDSCRQFYFCKFMTSEFDPKIYLWFGECYPASFFEENRYDTFGLRKENMRHQMPTLCAVSHKTLLRNLNQYHQRYLIPPEKLPRYRIKLDSFMPTFLQDSTTSEQTFAYLNQENTYDDELATTTNFGFGFGTILNNSNLDDLYSTQNLYDTQHYDQAVYDQQPVYDQNETFDQSNFETQQFDNQQFDNQQFDNQQFDGQQFDQSQYDQQQFIPEPQYDQQQFDQTQFDQQQQFVPPEFDQNQFNQQFDNQQLDQFQNQQYDQNQFEQPQFIQESYDPNQFGQQQFDQAQFSQQQYDQPQFTQEQFDPNQFTPQPPLQQVQILPPEPQVQQQHQNHSSEDFSKTLNRFMSKNVIDYEDQAPELPSLRSDLQQPQYSSKQPNEVTEVKPLLQCTIKPRDKSTEQPSNLPPPMFPVTTETTESSSSFIVPPPSPNNVSIPPPSNVTIPPPTQTSQQFIPAPAPAPVPVPPVQQPAPVVQQVQQPIIQNITVIPPPQQPVQQNQSQPLIPPPEPASEPKVTIEKTVTITETTIENKQQQQQKAPESTLSATPPIFSPMIPPPTTTTPTPSTTASTTTSTTTPTPSTTTSTTTPTPSTTTSTTTPTPSTTTSTTTTTTPHIPPPSQIIPPPPSSASTLNAVPPKKKRTFKFPSAAGTLKLQSTYGLGSPNPLPSAKRTVKVDNGTVVEIPDETTLNKPEPVHEWKPFDDIDVPDLAVSSTAASRQEVPKLIVIESPVTVENFYQSETLPFNFLQPTLSIPVGTMSHPLQARVFLKPPNIRILGVPEEW